MRSKRPPLSRWARRVFAFALAVFVMFYVVYNPSANAQATLLFAPDHVITTALFHGWATALFIILAALFFHWAIQPIDRIPPVQTGGGSTVFIILIGLYGIFWAGQQAYQKHLYKGYGYYQKQELPTVATYQSGGRSKSFGFITLGIDSQSHPLWNFNNDDGREWRADKGHCISTLIGRTRTGVVYALTPNEAQKPCDKAWPALTAAQQEYLRRYAHLQSPVLGRFRIRQIIDYAAAGIESRPRDNSRSQSVVLPKR
jgi:hypothetical protein